MRKGQIRWQKKNGAWSEWYDINEPMPQVLRAAEIVSVELHEEMTKAEYDSLEDTARGLNP